MIAFDVLSSGEVPALGDLETSDSDALEARVAGEVQRGVWSLHPNPHELAREQGSPLQPLLPLLAQARDVGLHLALARRAGGASRAHYEPAIQTVRELGSPGLSSLVRAPRVTPPWLWNLGDATQLVYAIVFNRS